MLNPEPRIPLSAPDVTEADIARVVETLRQRTLSRGPRQAEFEARFARCVGVPHAVAVSSGTADLHLALTAVGAGPGDEVLTSPFAVPATANAIRMTGARPVYADIEADTLNLDPRCARDAISGRTRAVLAVHTFGLPADLPALADLGVPVVEDACEALGATRDGRPVGSLGDLGVFGFYPNKQITTGEGGMVVTANAEHARRMRALRNHGRTGGGWLDQNEAGFNYRLSEIACTLGLAQLGRLDAVLERRARVAEQYRGRLAGVPGLRLPPSNPHGRSSWFVFVVLIESPLGGPARDRIARRLAQRGIESGRYFAPLHLQPVARGVGRPFPVTESVAARTLALPFFNRLTDAEIQDVCAALTELLRAELARA